MELYSSGQRRKKSNPVRRESDTARLVFAVGAVTAVMTLILPFAENTDIPHTNHEEAVAVMSHAAGSGKEAHEELIKPSHAEPAEEWSIYDYIGELFAELISGIYG